MKRTLTALLAGTVVLSGYLQDVGIQGTPAIPETPKRQKHRLPPVQTRQRRLPEVKKLKKRLRQRWRSLRSGQTMHMSRS